MRLREKLSAFKRKKCQKKHLTNQLSYVAAMNYIDSEKKLLDSEKKNFEIKEELLKYKEIIQQKDLELYHLENELKEVIDEKDREISDLENDIDKNIQESKSLLIKFNRQKEMNNDLLKKNEIEIERLGVKNSELEKKIAACQQTVNLIDENGNIIDAVEKNKELRHQLNMQILDNDELKSSHNNLRKEWQYLLSMANTYSKNSWEMKQEILALTGQLENYQQVSSELKALKAKVDKGGFYKFNVENLRTGYMDVQTELARQLLETERKLRASEEQVNFFRRQLAPLLSDVNKQGKEKLKGIFTTNQ